MKKKKCFKLRAPLTIKGGIRAQTEHAGPFRVWWSRRWTDVLEGFRMGPRLGRGRHYAISGQVSELSLISGCVAAEVQGALADPYRCSIRFASLEAAQKEKVVAALKTRPMLIARLLAGELPHDVETLFEQVQAPLFPRRSGDIQSKCSCPDWANPCKHLAAVYCLLGETISKNPLLLLALRGISRADLIAELSNNESTDKEVASLRQKARIKKSCAHDDPLTSESFYGTSHPPLADFGALPHSDIAAPLVQRLGPLPFWRGQERFTDTLEHLYARAASRGMTVWSGDPLDLRRPEEKIIVKGASLHLKQHLRIERA
ncbi:MAG: SWIM zinc finger family protein [bacterium]